MDTRGKGCPPIGEKSIITSGKRIIKKDGFTRKAAEEEIKIETKITFELIRGTIEKYRLRGMVSYLCKLMGVSRSGYYKYFNEPSVQNRAK